MSNKGKPGKGAGAVIIAAAAGIAAKIKNGKKKNRTAKNSPAKYSGKH